MFKLNHKQLHVHVEYTRCSRHSYKLSTCPAHYSAYLNDQNLIKTNPRKIPYTCISYNFYWTASETSLQGNLDPCI